MTDADGNPIDFDKSYSYRGLGCRVEAHYIPVTEEYWDDEAQAWYLDHDLVIGDMVECIWYGDDTIHIVDPEELIEVAEESVCSCGQIKCWADGTDYE